jgi:hypothetical protein
MSVAREIIAMARDDGRLGQIMFRDDDSGEATALLQGGIEAQNADRMVVPPEPSQRPRPRDEFGF